MKHRKLFIILAIIFALIVAALYIYIYTIPEITGALIKTCTVEYGEMRIVKEVSAVIVRQETVYSAESSGNVSYYVSNNTKTRKGIKILEIYGDENQAVNCPQTGVVSYYYDGYENVITPGSISNLKAIIPTESAIEVKDLSCKKIQESEPLYKLITSDLFYTVFNVSPEEIDSYVTGSAVTLEFETGSVSAKISEIIPVYGEPESSAEAETAAETEGEAEAVELPIEEYIVVVSTAKYFADYDKLRQCNVNVVLRDDKGLLIPNTAIGEEDGNAGVYVKGIDGEYYFTRIKVINTDGTNSVVYSDTFNVLREDGLSDIVSTISIYDEILKDASGQNK